MFVISIVLTTGTIIIGLQYHHDVDETDVVSSYDAKNSIRQVLALFQFSIQSNQSIIATAHTVLVQLSINQVNLS